MFEVEQKTREEIIKDQLLALNFHAENSLENYKSMYQKGFDLVWKNSLAEPQELFDAMGQQAYKIFATAQKVILHIRELDPSYIPPSPDYDYEVKKDGTVVSTKKIPPSVVEESTPEPEYPDTFRWTGEKPEEEVNEPAEEVKPE